MSVVTTTLVVSLSADAIGSPIFSAEFDDRLAIEGGLNDGDTDFAPGDNLGFLLYRSRDVDDTSIVITPSLGSIVTLGGGTKSVTEFVHFPKTREVAPKYPVYSGFTYSWMGTSLGTLSATTDRSLVATTSGVAVAKVTYTTSFLQYRLVNTLLTGENEYDVLIYIEGNTL